MNIIAKTKQVLSGLARKYLDGDNTLGWVTLTGGNTDTNENAFMHANISAILNACCNGKTKLYNSDGEEIPWKKKGDEPLLDLLYRPSPFYNEAIFKKILVLQILAYGNAYILKTAEDMKKLPSMLIPIPAPCVTLLYNDKGYPKGYKVQTTGGPVEYSLEQIIHIREPQLDNLFVGKGRIAYSKLDVEIMNSAKVFNLNYFKNGADVGGVIQFPTDTKVTDEAAVNLVKAWNDNHQGEQKAHRTAYLKNGAVYNSFKTSHKDMEYVQGLNFSEQQIYSLMGVPPILLGLLDRSANFNSKEQQKVFYENNVMPLMTMFSDGYNEGLLPLFYPNEDHYLSYDFSSVKALEEDWLNKAQAASLLLQTWPANEVKRALNLPFKDLPNGNEPPNPVYSAFGMYAAPKYPVKSLTFSKIDFKSSVYKRPSKTQMDQQRINRDLLYLAKAPLVDEAQRKHFKAQRDMIAEFIKNNPSELATYSAALGSSNAQAVQAMALKAPAYADIFSEQIKSTQDLIQKIAGKKDMKFYDAKTMSDRVAEWLDKNAFQWLRGAEETTLNQMNAIIQAGVDNGWSNAKTNKFLLDFFSEEGYEPMDIASNGTSIYNRIQNIVATETRATISEAQLEGYRSTPFVNGRGWITTSGIADHHPGHLEMSGQEVGMNEPFRNPVTGNITMAPGRFGIAGEDCYCFCDTYPIVRIDNAQE